MIGGAHRANTAPRRLRSARKAQVIHTYVYVRMKGFECLCLPVRVSELLRHMLDSHAYLRLSMSVCFSLCPPPSSHAYRCLTSVYTHQLAYYASNKKGGMEKWGMAQCV